MLDYIEGNTDVLVCTTIVENGLDIPNANTISVQDVKNTHVAMEGVEGVVA